jgi:hypothetical protein
MSKISDMFYSGIRKSQVDRSISKRQATPIAYDERKPAAILRNPKVDDGHSIAAADQVPYAGVATDIRNEPALLVARIEIAESPFAKKAPHGLEEIIRIAPKTVRHRQAPLLGVGLQSTTIEIGPLIDTPRSRHLEKHFSLKLDKG